MQEDLFELTNNQMEIWLSQLIHIDNPLYNIAHILKIEGNIFYKILKKSVEHITSVHDVLSIQITTKDGIPFQKIVPINNIELIYLDFSNANNPEKDAKEWACNRGMELFKLYDNYLWECALIKVRDSVNYLFFKFHHIINDGWGVSVCFKEICNAYNRLSNNQPLIHNLQYSYLEFVNHENYYKNSNYFTKCLEFWRDYFNSIPDVMLHKNLCITDEKSTRQVFEISQVTFNALDTLSKTCNATTFHLLLAIIYIYFSRITRNNNLCIGIPVLNRTKSKFKKIIGMCLSYIPIRIHMPLDCTLQELVLQIRYTVNNCYRYHRMPISKIRQAIGLKADESLFDVVLSYDTADYIIPFLGYETQLHWLENKYQQQPFVLNVKRNTKKVGDVEAIIDCRAKFFYPLQLKDISRHLIALINNVATSQANDKIVQMSFLTDNERQKILFEWNKPYKKEYPKNKTIHQLFEKQVKKTPNNTAVVFENEALSYQRLNEQANQLAHYLREMGVKPDTFVAIACERSLEMIIGILGIFKAGGAYLPLDPSYPKDRLSYMIQDAKATLLLTQTHLLDKLPQIQAEVILLDFRKFASYPIFNPESITQPHHLAYVIYTSGSTGKPKGVLIEHKNVVRLMSATDEWYCFNQKDIWTLFHSYAFDFSVWEIWGALLYGGKLVIVSYLTARSPEIFYNLLVEEKVTVLNQTPLSFKKLIEYEESRIDLKKLSLRLVIFGGDVLNLQDLLSWFDRHRENKPQLINMYGVTETTVHVTYAPIDKKLIVENKGSIIGRPIPDLQIYILDAALNPVPIGIVGKVYIGGNGLARGYLNNPALTIEKFIENPFRTEEEKSLGQNARLYNTGDLCRWLKDGNIEYIGRADEQVKIRGFRIELGEVESVLLQYPDIQEAVVIAREDDRGDKKLAAYIVLNNVNINMEELKSFLKKQLPSYMLPSALVVIDSLPLTHNGKLDRKKLPHSNYQYIVEKYTVPTTETEKNIATAWQKTLSCELVSIHDNFFEVGGHSLSVIQVVNFLKKHYDIEIPVKVFFELSTISALAQFVENNKNKYQGEIILLTPMQRPEYVPLSFSQNRLWFINQLNPNSPLYNIPFVLRLKGNLNKEALEWAINKIIERHEVLKTSFNIENNQPYQFVNFSLKFSITWVDLCKSSKEKQQEYVKLHVNEESLKPFNLQTDLLIRLKIIKLYLNEYILLFVLHHIIADEWSLNIIIKEISEFYNAFLENRDVVLPPLLIQYADFTLWQREYLKKDKGMFKKQLDFWVTQLENAPKCLDFPFDHVRPNTQSYKGERTKFKLSDLLLKKIKDLSLKNNTTLFMTFLTIFYILLHKYSRQKDIVIGFPIANRNQHDLKDLIGFFVNTIALRIYVPENQTFTNVLQKVKQTFLEAQEHQDLPFDEIVNHLDIERSLAYHPLFQVMFSWENKREMYQLNNIKVSAESIYFPVSKFDLTLTFNDTKEGLYGIFEYATDLFNASTIDRMVKHYETLMENIVKDPSKKINYLNILTEKEKKEILIDWNKTYKKYPKNKTIHELFEEQVKKTPNNIAVVFEDWQITYQELNQRANQIAYLLRHKGVKADVLVAIACEKSVEMIIGILGILKAGGAYVPLDPSYPAERLAYILNDTKAFILLTQKHLVKFLPEIGVKIIFLDKEQEETKKKPFTNMASITQSYHLAYVIYTSGSTGRPKGVMIEHSNVSRLILNQNYIEIKSSSVIAQAANIAFDAATFEIWGALLLGAKLILLETESILSAQSLKYEIERHKIDTMWLTASFFNRMVNYDCNLFSTVKNLIIGGEPLDARRVKRFLIENRLTQLINGYGPTESTTFAVCNRLSNSSSFLTKVPIGRPIANTKAYILDSLLNPVPVGIIGELHLGGDGLARGYLEQPALTEEKFINNPFQNKRDKILRRNFKIYKTGDLCRWLPDGNIEYIGRFDEQIKIRGFRVELGEVESVLLQYPGIREAAVIAIENSPEDKRLVAYIVLSDVNIKIKNKKLKDFLKRQLPSYMLPSAFVMLDFLPLNHNKKLDKKNLPTPNYECTVKKYVVPQTITEKIVTKIWQKTLHIDCVGIHNNFFDLGGNSLLLIQLHQNLQNELNKQFPLIELFQHPTVSDFSYYLTGLSKYNSKIMTGRDRAKKRLRVNQLEKND